jgi:hypothetical protein
MKICELTVNSGAGIAPASSGNNSTGLKLDLDKSKKSRCLSKMTFLLVPYIKTSPDIAVQLMREMA